MGMIKEVTPRQTAMPIQLSVVSAALAYDDPTTGEVIIVVIHQETNHARVGRLSTNRVDIGEPGMGPAARFYVYGSGRCSSG
eukprot:scaffold113054_cov31-Attheya_sp.AAC.1